MIEVHHLIRSRSERVIWLMEELGEPYEIFHYRRERDMSAPAAYRALHPVGTSPIIRDGGLTLVETGAIVDYILGTYGKGRLVPTAGTDDYGRYVQWFHFAEGSAAFSFLTEAILLANAEAGAEPNWLVKLWRDRNDRIIPYVDDELGRRPYFAGAEFTAADIMMAHTFGTYERFLKRPLPANITAYCDRVLTRPAYLKAMAIADSQRRA